MKQFWIQVVVLLIIIFGALLYTFNNSSLGLLSTPSSSGPVVSSSTPGANQQVLIKLDDTVIKTEIADTPDKRMQGLGGRDSIASDSGMLFLFQNPSKYRFWMKGMKFPLDFIWIRGDTVVDILPNIQPPSPNQPDSTLPVYEPVTDVDKVLEVNAGFVSSHGVRVGDKIYQVQQ